MRLRDLRLLFIDCQTTGMRPPAAHLLELAWTYSSASEEKPEVVTSHLISLPETHKLPPRVSEITGIRSEDLAEARDVKDVFREFQSHWKGEPALIHYAQFERAFLADLFAPEEIPFRIICTHQLTKLTFPNLPSQNIRGAAGFFGVAPGALKRAGEHVHATHQIWRGLVTQLEKTGVETLAGLEEFQTQKPKKTPARYEYRMDRIKRLELPDQPGIYRMLSKSGEVLYVGKATSLKSRVNSYFRGQKGRDRRKLEMLAQVWDLKVTACASPLEAALMECDEIKKYDPPYNVVLKRGRRHLVFYNRDFTQASATQSAEFLNGPFRNSNWIEHLRLLIKSIGQEEFEQIFFNPIPPETLREGWEICARQLGLANIHSARTLLARGMWLHKNYVEPEEEHTQVEEVAEEEAEEREATAEEVAGKFERLLRRAAAELHRARQLSRLLNARVSYSVEKMERQLHFRSGIVDGAPSENLRLPWQGLDIGDFDRMSILKSELVKYEHRIELNY